MPRPLKAAIDKWIRECADGVGGTGPMCRCGARNTARIGDSVLTRQCQACGQTYAYRLRDGLLVPLSLETALTLEGK